MSISHNLDDLEQFQGGSRAKNKDPIVKIQVAKGRINLYFTSGFLALVGEDFKNHIILSYSKKSNAIAFEFVENLELPGILKITKKPHLNTGTLSIFSFVKKFQLNEETLSGDYLPIRKPIGTNQFMWVVFLDQKWN